MIAPSVWALLGTGPVLSARRRGAGTRSRVCALTPDRVGPAGPRNQRVGPEAAVRLTKQKCVELPLAVSQTPTNPAQPAILVSHVVPSVKPSHLVHSALVKCGGECSL
jgi:hypothetical protein